MRGNHRMIGRCDYTEPAPLSEAQRLRIATVEVEPVPDRKKWFAVTRNGDLLGYVATRMYGQEFRTPGLEFWVRAATDWNRADPPHGRAILRLLDEVESPETAAPSTGTEP